MSIPVSQVLSVETALRDAENYASNAEIILEHGGRTPTHAWFVCATLARHIRELRAELASLRGQATYEHVTWKGGQP